MLLAAMVMALSALAALLWYGPCVNSQGVKRALDNKALAVLGLKYGFLYAGLLILAVQLAWDKLFAMTGIRGLAKDLIEAFFRAALIEEFFKGTAFLLAKRRRPLSRRIDYMLLCGLMGLVYGVWEQARLLDVAAMVIGVVAPLHLMWQMCQGEYIYEYERARARGDMSRAEDMRFKATAGVFLAHGCWSALLNVAAFLMDAEEDGLVTAGMVLALALAAAGVVYCVRTVKHACRVARESEPVAA